LTKHEELRSKGDELDKAVRTAEEELRALENTVLVMVSLNESARGFVSSTTNPQFEEEKKKLREILEESEKVMKQARENRRVFRASVLRFTVEISTLDDEARRLDENAAAHELELMRMTEKNAELEERLNRAERNLTMAMDKVTQSKPKAQLDISVVWLLSNCFLLLLFSP
uniref:Coiled-coil domain-containing protein 39 n=1 Tax=Schistocephalus solidus TaxID=70667 RepID=A0A183TTX2_SCHSO